ncbi:MAG: hypothetical protein NZ658_03945 [Pirellulales bacterium]|nr:hypothetical protein [Pirellulales bacterium]MDA0253295.1 hypothetical protein [Planctomycetota bacterium]
MNTAASRPPRQRMSLLRRFNRAVARGVRAVAESPWIKFLTGTVLLTSSLDEAIDTLVADLSALELGAHHGVMLLGFVNILSSLPDLLDGLLGTLAVDDEQGAAAGSDVAGGVDATADADATDAGEDEAVAPRLAA